jgi:hypothetical protein
MARLTPIGAAVISVISVVVMAAMLVWLAHMACNEAKDVKLWKQRARECHQKAYPGMYVQRKPGGTST